MADTAMAGKPKTIITRTVRVTFDREAVMEILRRECGAPRDAAVFSDSYDDWLVEWSNTEGGTSK